MREISWQRNLIAVTAASFIGFTGFTLVMPFLPLFISQLGVTEVGEIALWSGISLGVTPAVTALCAPLWGRVADRFGRKIMVERSLLSFVIVMTATAYVTRPWQVLALRAVQGLFAGYGALTLTMAAESAPRERMAAAIGTVQTAQRLGPALGPVIGGLVAGAVGLRRAFLVTAGFYAVAFVLVLLMYREPQARGGAETGHADDRVSFRSVLAFQNFVLLMGVIFGLQFVDRSFGPILPLYVGQMGIAPADVPLVSGLLFSVMAALGALGHQVCARLLTRASARGTILGGVVPAGVALMIFALLPDGTGVWAMILAACLFGVGLGMAQTAAYTSAGSVIPAGAHGVGFGFLTSASLVGLALSPMVSGLLGRTNIRLVFLLDLAALGALASMVWRVMVERPLKIETPPVEEA